MASLTITIPDTQLQRVLDGFAALYRDTYNANTETKQQHLKRRVIKYIKTIVQQAEHQAAIEALPPPDEVTPT